MSRSRLAAREARRVRDQARTVSQRRAQLIRTTLFGLIVVGALGGGVLVATGDLLGQRGTTRDAGAIAVRASMAGFTPSVIQASAGEVVTIDFWTTDAAPHLRNGVHTMISDELGIYEELPAESRATFSFTAPMQPGDYDIYCDTCCGGKASPSMHGTIRVRS
jgi:plastocyanin